MKYLTAEQILFIHARLIDSTGGAHGIRDVGLLQSAAARPRATFEGKDLYKDAFMKAAALAESLARNHCFVDGNKRIAITAAGIFLNLNGLRFEAEQREVIRFGIALAAKHLSLDAVMMWFKKHCPAKASRKPTRRSR